MQWNLLSELNLVKVYRLAVLKSGYPTAAQAPHWRGGRKIKATVISLTKDITNGWFKESLMGAKLTIILHMPYKYGRSYWPQGCGFV